MIHFSLQRKIFYILWRSILLIFMKLGQNKFNPRHYIKISNISVSCHGWEVTFECSGARLQSALRELIYYWEYFCILRGSCYNCKPDSVWFICTSSMKYIYVWASCGGCEEKNIIVDFSLSKYILSQPFRSNIKY